MKYSEVNHQCALCPLNRMRAGLAVRIKKLCASPEVSQRLREIGFCEDQVVKLVTSQTNIICLVCNARLAISAPWHRGFWLSLYLFRKAFSGRRPCGGFGLFRSRSSTDTLG